MNAMRHDRSTGNFFQYLWQPCARQGIEWYAMIQFVCDTCSNIKQPEETWVVGLAAEAVGAVSARREVNIQSNWTREGALHPLAVHFCSMQCKDEYMTKLFGSEEIVVENTAPAEVVVERVMPEKSTVTTKATTARRRKRIA